MKKILIIKKPSEDKDLKYIVKSTNLGFTLASRIPGTDKFDFYRNIEIPKEWTNPEILENPRRHMGPKRYFALINGVESYDYVLPHPDDISNYLAIFNNVGHIWFERGKVDAIDLEDYYQQISVDPDTYELGDLSNVTFQGDIPQYEPSDIKTKSDLIDIFESKGWELQK